MPLGRQATYALFTLIFRMRLRTTHLSKIRMLSVFVLTSCDVLIKGTHWMEPLSALSFLSSMALSSESFILSSAVQSWTNGQLFLSRRKCLHDMSRQCNSTIARCPFQYFLGHAFYICFEFWCFLISFWPFPPEALHIFLFNLASCIFNSLEKQYTMHQCILSTICFDACIVCTKLT